MSTLKSFGLAFAFTAGLSVGSAHAQTPQWDADGTGHSFLAPNAGNPFAPFNATVGLTPSNGATLRVRGDQLPVADLFGGGLCTFRTDVAQVQQQSWWMYRDANPMGRIWHNSTHRAFHFQSMVPVDVAQDRYAGAMVQNNSNDGLWVVEQHDGAYGRADKWN